MQSRRYRTRPHVSALLLLGVALRFAVPFAHVLLVSRGAMAAEAGSWLAIERASGSEQCPDTDAVFAAMATLFPERMLERGHDASNYSTKATVLVQPTSSGHEALVRVVLPRPGERSLLVKRRDCVGLADALAVTLVMLLDAEPAAIAPLAPPAIEAPTVVVQGESSETVTVTTPHKPKITVEAQPGKGSSPAASPVPTSIPAQSPPTTASQVPATEQIASANHVSGRPSRWAIELWAAPNASDGLLSQPALGPALGTLIRSRSWLGLSVHGLRLWSLAAQKPPGKITLTLWGLLLGPCIHVEPSTRTHMDACLQLGVGQQRAESEGYLHPGHAQAPWVVLGPSARLHREFARTFSGFVALGVVGQLQQENFLIDGINGPVARATRAGLWVETGLSFRVGEL